MDLDEWELLPDSKSFLDLGHDHEGGGGGGGGGGKQLLRRELPFDDKLVLEMNYFICPPKSAAPSRHEDSSGDDDGKFKDIAVVVPPPPPPMIFGGSDVVSQVLFKKAEENGFPDVKVASSESCRRGFAVPLPEPEPIQRGAGEEDTDCGLGQEAGMALQLAKGTAEAKSCDGSDVKSEHGWEDGNGGSVCRWKMAGVGALCSIGAAAATICCIFVLAGGQGQKQQRPHQKIQFQIYADDKRMKRAVHQATRLNHALSAVRGGAPMTRAHISFGGYYEGL